jgi:two-component system, sporulation sensor kinase A
MNLPSTEQTLLYQTFYNASIGLAISDRDGRLLKVNSALCSMLGYTENDLLHMSIRDVTYPEDLQPNLNYNEKLYAGQIECFQLEKRYIHRDGHLVWGLLTVSAIYDEEGQPTLSMAQLIDKTKDHRIQAAMDRLNSLYRYTSEGIAILNADGIILQVNPAFEQLFGWSEAEIQGKRFPVTPEISVAHAEYLMQETMQGRPVTGFETLKQRKDGTLITVTITTSPIRDEHGNIYAMAGIIRDETKRKQRDEELIATKVQLESFISNNMDPIFIFDSCDRLVRVNAAVERTFGWKAEELLGLRLEQIPLIPPDSVPEVTHNKKEIDSKLGVHGYETVRLKKDGSPIHVMLSMFPLQNNEWAAILRDITERKQSEEVMVKNEKLSIAGQLAAGIAHEIRNPVTAIKGFLQLMQRGLGKPNYLDIMGEEIKRIELILSELLILAKPQAVKFERKDLRPILDHVIALLDAQANLNNTEITTELDESAVLLPCDENQLKQVFINFIKNAIDAMPKGGKLLIQSSRWKEDHVCIRFMDEGCGIPKHIVERLGQPFYTTKEKGTGLGFMVSKRIIETHGGRVQVFSEENKGTTVEVILPLE